jgi:hypothetical protein
LQTRLSKAQRAQQTHDSLQLENEQLYKKLGLLEVQLERLVCENQSIREAQAKELMQDFSVQNYVKWRSTIQTQSTIDVDEGQPTPQLALQRENARLKDELMQARVDVYQSKQLAQHHEETLAASSSSLEDANAEISKLKKALESSICEQRSMLDELEKCKETKALLQTSFDQVNKQV